jgi:hypothetical protein
MQFVTVFACSFHLHRNICMRMHAGSSNSFSCTYMRAHIMPLAHANRCISCCSVALLLHFTSHHFIEFIPSCDYHSTRSSHWINVYVYSASRSRTASIELHEMFSHNVVKCQVLTRGRDTRIRYEMKIRRMMKRFWILFVDENPNFNLSHLQRIRII